MRDYRWARHSLWGISSGKNRHEDRLETRRGPSTFKNMPFKGQEDALLEARRACSQTLFITRWFIVGYISAFSRLFPPIVRALNANICTGSLPSESCSSSSDFTANISGNAHSLCQPQARHRLPTILNHYTKCVHNSTISIGRFEAH